MCGSREGIQCIQGICGSQVLDVSLWSFGAFWGFDDLVSRRKRLAVERKRQKFGTRGMYACFLLEEILM